MEINSIIDTIKRSIITGTPADVKITDKSFLAELLGKDDDNNTDIQPPKIIYRPHFNGSMRFPVIHYVLQCLWTVITLFIALLYFLPSKILLLLTGKKRDLRLSARFNAVLFITCVTSYIVILAFSVTFLLKSVLFFDPDNRINSQGAIMMRQPLGVEQYVYLFNAATLWANTGIELLENDRIEVSASGSFYGKISDLCEKAGSNDTLSYKWNNPMMKSSDTTFNDLCIYKSREAHFGSLLFQICPEKNSLSYSSADSVTLTEDKDVTTGMKNEMVPFKCHDGKKFSFTAHMDGILFLAVNDIYLNDGTINTIKEKSRNKEIKKLLNGRNPDSLKTNRYMWFQDNIGEILLNISVYRNAAADNNSALMPDAIPKIYRDIESVFNNETDNKNLITILVAIIFIIADFGIGKALAAKKNNKGKSAANDNTE